MKRLLIALVIVAWCPRSEASNYGCQLILNSHVNFLYCSNYCRRSDMAMFYYSGLMEALNEHIGRRLQEGKLQAKKFEISFAEPLGDMHGPVVAVTQNRRGYHITARDARDLNFGYLSRVVDYFASKNWKSFYCCDAYTRVTPDDVRRNFGRILDREVGDPGMSFFDGRRSIVLELGELQLVYENDRLVFSLAGKRAAMSSTRRWRSAVTRRSSACALFLLPISDRSRWSLASSSASIRRSRSSADRCRAAIVAARSSTRRWMSAWASVSSSGAVFPC